MKFGVRQESTAATARRAARTCLDARFIRRGDRGRCVGFCRGATQVHRQAGGVFKSCGQCQGMAIAAALSHGVLRHHGGFVFNLNWQVERRQHIARQANSRNSSWTASATPPGSRQVATKPTPGSLLGNHRLPNSSNPSWDGEAPARPTPAPPPSSRHACCRHACCPVRPSCEIDSPGLGSPRGSTRHAANA